MSSVEHIQHDPRTKQQIKDALYDHLYRPVMQSFQERLKEIIVKNTIAGRYTHKSFVYKNTMYSCDTGLPPRRSNRLQPSVQPEMDAYLKDLKQLNEQEIPYVVGYINQVLNSSNHLYDYYKLLPDSLHEPLRAIIETSPCKGNALSEEQAQQLQTSNQDSLNLMKQRLVINLII